MAIVYQIDNLTKVYKKSEKKANNALTFDIKEGEIFGLLGPNGAGKSTLVHQITGLLSPTSGTISLYGLDIVRHPHLITHYVAMQPQHTEALKELYPQEALSLTAQLRNVRQPQARKAVAELMDEFEAYKWAKTPIRFLSGGQKQLMTLLLSFIGNRPVQIFDEPTNNLDPVVRRQVWEKLLSLNRQGTTIILVTHNVLEAEKVIQRIGILNDGCIQALGTLAELKTRIDQSVRLELFVKEERAEQAAETLHVFAQAYALTPFHWIVRCPQEEVTPTIQHIMASAGLESLNDFRIVTPSLEDVYLQLGDPHVTA
jgi:ABC-type multidrug transport system ATPase subunit